MDGRLVFLLRFSGLGEPHSGVYDVLFSFFLQKITQTAPFDITVMSRPPSFFHGCAEAEREGGAPRLSRCECVAHTVFDSYTRERSCVLMGQHGKRGRGRQ